MRHTADVLKHYAEKLRDSDLSREERDRIDGILAQALRILIEELEGAEKSKIIEFVQTTEDPALKEAKGIIADAISRSQKLSQLLDS